MKKNTMRYCGILIIVAWATFANVLAAEQPSGEAKAIASQTITLDGPDWRIATDPDNKGRDEKWFAAPRPEAKPTPVPWVIQNIFPGYHGVAWYWRTFKAPANPHLNGRYLLQFGAVDYLAQVWVNGYAVGEHEGGETPFTLDVTDAIRPGQENLLAVRVLNPPENRRIDGFILKETASGCKHDNIAANVLYNSGGIVGAVELLMVPQLRIADLHVLPDWKTGEIRIRAALLSTCRAVRGHRAILGGVGRGWCAPRHDELQCARRGGHEDCGSQPARAEPSAVEPSRIPRSIA